MKKLGYSPPFYPPVFQFLKQEDKIDERNLLGGCLFICTGCAAAL